MNRAKRIYLSIIVICLIVISTSMYYVLGGFEKNEIFVLEGATRTVVGKEYIGKMTQNKFREMMNEARMFIEENKLKGQLTLVSYQNDTIGIDSVHFYIGASFDSVVNILQTPPNYTFKTYRTDNRYKMFITQHPIVRPTPDEIQELMEKRALQDEKELFPYTFELYYSDESLSVEAWAK